MDLTIDIGGDTTHHTALSKAPDAFIDEVGSSESGSEESGSESELSGSEEDDTSSGETTDDEDDAPLVKDHNRGNNTNTSTRSGGGGSAGQGTQATKSRPSEQEAWAPVPTEDAGKSVNKSERHKSKAVNNDTSRHGNKPAKPNEWDAVAEEWRRSVRNSESVIDSNDINLAMYRLMADPEGIDYNHEGEVPWTQSQYLRYERTGRRPGEPSPPPPTPSPPPPTPSAHHSSRTISAHQGVGATSQEADLKDLEARVSGLNRTINNIEHAVESVLSMVQSIHEDDRDDDGTTGDHSPSLSVQSNEARERTSTRRETLRNQSSRHQSTREQGTSRRHRDALNDGGGVRYGGRASADSDDDHEPRFWKRPAEKQTSYPNPEGETSVRDRVVDGVQMHRCVCGAFEKASANTAPITVTNMDNENKCAQMRAGLEKLGYLREQLAGLDYFQLKSLALTVGKERQIHDAKRTTVKFALQGARTVQNLVAKAPPLANDLVRGVTNAIVESLEEEEDLFAALARRSKSSKAKAHPLMAFLVKTGKQVGLTVLETVNDYNESKKAKESAKERASGISRSGGDNNDDARNATRRRVQVESIFVPRSRPPDRNGRFGTGNDGSDLYTPFEMQRIQKNIQMERELEEKIQLRAQQQQQQRQQQRQQPPREPLPRVIMPDSDSDDDDDGASSNITIYD